MTGEQFIRYLLAIILVVIIVFVAIWLIGELDEETDEVSRLVFDRIAPADMAAPALIEWCHPPRCQSAPSIVR